MDVFVTSILFFDLWWCFMVKEASYQASLIKKLKDLFPGCVVLKNDSGYLQGIPDITVLYRDKWAVLEVKASADSPERPNQKYYIDKLDSMSYSAFICPENEKAVLHDLQQTFGFDGATCVFES
jgi:hypothetical protein